MRRLSRSKGQFFFISLMLMVVFISGIQVLLSGFSEIDLSRPYNRQEDFLFWNIKTQTVRAIEKRPCPTLVPDFNEIKMSTTEYLAKKGIHFEIENTSVLCNGPVKPPEVNVTINMTSSQIALYESFSVNP